MTRAAIHLRPFQPGDEAKFELRLDFAREMRRLNWDWRKPPAPTWTLVRFPDQVIGFGGFVAQGLGHFQAFCFLAHVPRGDWPKLIDCARVAIDDLRRGHDAIVATALVREGFAGGAAVLERLGFLRSAEATAWPGYRVMAREL